MTTTTTGFDEHALARLPSPAPFLDEIRAQAFEAFEALPIPSQETEEWRYTDLEGFGFDLRPFVEGGRAENLDQVPEEILAAAGEVGERAGLQIQRNSEVMVTHLDPVARRQGRLVRRPGPRDRRAPRPRRALPARPRPGRPLEVHGPARRVPLRRDVPVRAARRRDRAAAAGDDRGSTPRTRRSSRGRSWSRARTPRSRYIDRYGVARRSAGALSDAIVEIHAGPGSRVRYVALQEYGDGVTHLAVQRGADRPRTPTSSRSGSRSARASRAWRSRACWPRTAAAPRCSACTSATASSTSTFARSRITSARAPRATSSTRAR